MQQNTSTEHFEDVARRTVEAMPGIFRKAAREVALLVAEWPAAEMLRELGISHRLELTGLYEGIPVTEKSVWDQPQQPDVVWLFRQPILAEWRDRGDVTLDELITHVTIHEFAHHFGWSDDDIAAIDRWWE
ncbi:metallopeptidase family protein [Albibacillus kandeliae]|uniref:metallopeptidase family protein n=1 Tax=Albibacillus kandeliae TaxID=2174228 RepID=UPI000D68D645|nr:metallopeptidase family protein [Albibacillus kandeliae]